MAHKLACRAHAIGCAVENLRDAHMTDDPVATGDAYLTDGVATCYCDRDMAWAARWVTLGVMALDTHDTL